MSTMTAVSAVDESVVNAWAFTGWKCCATRAGSVTHPDELVAVDAEWHAATVPGTAASALSAAGRWDFHRPVDIDTSDWWWCATFAQPLSDTPIELVFDGLATLAEVWLNGQRVQTTDNMFRQYRVDITDCVLTENSLAIVFRSLTSALQQKRPRPRWKTNLVDHQQLRWFRTTLLGHIPGWSPPVAAVGPWRDIRLESSKVRLIDSHIQARLVANEGVITFRSQFQSAWPIERATLRVGNVTTPLRIEPDSEGKSITLLGDLVVPQPNRWWPHTHGSQSRYDASVEVWVDDQAHSFPLAPIGFRQLEIDEQSHGFAVRINGEDVYCRGACWTVSDIFVLDGSEALLRRDLELAREAGINLLRVGGTMIYESETFFRLCDELGLMVWQDFMFANMAYPVDDPAFVENITVEATQLLRRTAGHPSVVVYCGGSEIEQQAAMLGLPEEMWSNPWFAETLPALCHELHPSASYVRGSPTGGTLPFDPQCGVSHYYGIGAYRRSLSELRQADVKFTTECLGFSNLPESAVIAEIMDGGGLVTHAPQWKQRVPRDTGAGWDFEDIRDHYLHELYGVEAMPLRASDPLRYQQLSRTVPGEMMSRAFAEWRSAASSNGGGLVWFYKDLWPAAGWGVLDSYGQPKPTYYYLKRAWQSQQLTITDEGLSGLRLHIINESATDSDVIIEITLLKQPRQTVLREECPISLRGRETRSLNVNELLGRFCDVNYAYRFGPAAHDVVIATLMDARRNVVSEAFYFLRRENPAFLAGHTLTAALNPIDSQTWQLELDADAFLQTVRLSAKGFQPSDNYFHLTPQRRKSVRFRALDQLPRGIKVDVEALNVDSTMTVIPQPTTTTAKA